MLTVQGLNKRFGRKTVLRDLSIRFDEGVYGLLGPNGAGKTTLMRCLTRLYPVPAGAVQLNGVSVQDDRDYLRHIGYLPQKFGLFRELRVYEMLEMLANLKGMRGPGVRENIERCVAQVNLSEHLHSKVRTLSGGMVRRLGIAQALLGDPEILIFDEPTAGLDPEERLRFKRVIAEVRPGRTVLISTHIVSDVEASCDTVVVLDAGRIVTSGPSEALRRRAAGKTYLVPQTDAAGLQGDYVVQDQFEADGRIMLKVLSGQPQAFPAAEATLEDGYICALRGL